MKFITFQGKMNSTHYSSQSIPTNISSTIVAFFVILCLGLSGLNAQTVRDIFDLPPAARCVSQDLQVVQASLDYDNCGPSCEEGEIVYYDLTLAIDNTTGSLRTSFAFYARLEQYNPDGSLANTYFVTGCRGPVPPNQITSITFNESLQVLDENGNPTNFPGIPYLCGGSLKLINLYEAWTDASKNDNRQCPLDSSGIAPKCDVLPSIEIQTPLSAFVEEITDVSCYEGSDGAIDLTVSGGEEPYTFVWSRVGGGFSASTEDVSNLEAGTYSVTITDANNCTYVVDEIVVGQPSELQLTQDSVVDVSCFEFSDGSIGISVLGGTPPYIFAWLGPDGYTADTEDIQDLLAGVYGVTVTDDNGCTAQLSDILVGEPDELVATLDSFVDVSCFGFNDGSIDISVTGGTSPYSFSWTGPDGFEADIEDLVDLLTGEYEVTITDAQQCTAVLSDILIGQPDELIASVVAVEDASCAGLENGAIDIDVVGGTPPYTYVWSNGASSQDLTNVGAGSYSVTVTDDNGCVDTIEDILIEDPSGLEVTVESLENVSCYGLEDGAININVIGGTPPYTYAWSNGASSEDISGLDAGTYSVTVTDSQLCEFTLNDIVIGEPAQVPEPEVQVGPADCFQTAGSFAILNAPEGFTYSLDGGPWFAYTGSITDVAPGPHSLVARDANLCESEAVDFDVPEPFETPSEPDLSPVQPDCESLTGAIIVTSGTEGYLFSINGGDFIAYPSEGFAGLAPGDYEVRARSNDGCISDISYITLEEPVCDDFTGCTLGYWKNHTDRWCDAYQTCDLYGEVFLGAPSKLANLTLLEVLNLGGGGLNNLARQSVAALLNACSNEVNYELATTAAVIAYVQANFNNAGPAGSYLDMLNQRDCPLGGSSATTAPSPGCSSSESSSSADSAASGFSVSPVPFKDVLHVQYKFDYISDVVIEIFDFSGKKVKQVKESNASAGKITSINADFVSGQQLYVVKVSTNKGSFTQSVISGK